MCRQLRLDLLGLVVGALEDHEQAELAELCRKNPFVNERVGCLRRKLEALNRYFDRDCDPPPGLVERTLARIFSDEGSVPAPSPSIAVPTFITTPAAGGDRSAVSPSVAGPSEVIGEECEVAAFVSVGHETRGSSLSTKKGRTTKRVHAGQVYAATRSKRRQPEKSPAVFLPAGVVSEAGWWRAVLLLSACLAALAIIPPALYQSRVNAAGFRCQHLLCWLTRTGEHIAELRKPHLASAEHPGDRPLTPLLVVDIPSFAGEAIHTELMNRASVFEPRPGTHGVPAQTASFVVTPDGRCSVWGPGHMGTGKAGSGIVIMELPRQHAKRAAYQRLLLTDNRPQLIPLSEWLLGQRGFMVSGEAAVNHCLGAERDDHPAFGVSMFRQLAPGTGAIYADFHPLESPHLAIRTSWLAEVR